jgi:hypothetical protein
MDLIGNQIWLGKNLERVLYSVQILRPLRMGKTGDATVLRWRRSHEIDDRR